MGRSPCCDKVGLKKGPWTPEEDQKLLAYIDEHGHGSWRALPAKAGLQRCGKSCRLRWTNYLRPDIKRGKFSLQEEQTIIQLHALLGNRWSAIATHLPKRTDNEIKNYWNTHLKKRLSKMGIDPLTHKPKNDSLSSFADGSNSKNSANLCHMAQWESARLEAEARLVRQSKLRGSNNQLGSPTKPTAPTPVAPPLCLDILKFWNGIWTKPSTKNGPAIESPTSTLTYSENALPVPPPNFIELVGNSGNYDEEILKEECGEEDWDGITTNTMGSGWENDENDQGHSGNFAEKFTDLLLNNSGGDRNVDSDAGDGSGPIGSGSDCNEDNKNYWNSILNLVNSDSPVF